MKFVPLLPFKVPDTIVQHQACTMLRPLSLSLLVTSRYSLKGFAVFFVCKECIYLSTSCDYDQLELLISECITAPSQFVYYMYYNSNINTEISCKLFCLFVLNLTVLCVFF